MVGDEIHHESATALSRDVDLAAVPLELYFELAADNSADRIVAREP